MTHNYADNQRILDQLVRNEVIHCVSSLVSYFAEHPDSLKDDWSWEDDILPLAHRDDPEEAVCQECHEHVDEDGRHWFIRKDDVVGDVESLANHDDYFQLYGYGGWEQVGLDEYREVCDELNIDMDDYTCDALEHWAVNKWFAEKLREKGEAVGELFDFHIWGRTCTGQAISLDRVILEIAADMEILKGQKYEWKV